MTKKARHWTRPQPFQGEVHEHDLKLIEVDIPENLQPGGNTSLFSYSLHLLLLGIFRGAL